MHSEKTEILPERMEKNFSDYKPWANAGHSSEGVIRMSDPWELCWQKPDQEVLLCPAQLHNSGAASPGISGNLGQVTSSVSAPSTNSTVCMSSSASPTPQIWPSNDVHSQTVKRKQRSDPKVIFPLRSTETFLGKKEIDDFV